MAKVYLETSFFSACVSTRKSPKSEVWRETSLDWWERRHIHELFVSTEVIDELNAPAFRSRSEALAMLASIPALNVTLEVADFAQFLVNEKVMPSPASAGDAIHVALATLYEMDVLLSWNVKHLANPEKRKHLINVCHRVGRVPPSILTPDAF